MSQVCDVMPLIRSRLWLFINLFTYLLTYYLNVMKPYILSRCKKLKNYQVIEINLLSAMDIDCNQFTARSREHIVLVVVDGDVFVL